MIKYIADNHITLLRNGVEYFPALEEAIENAKIEIYLQTYIFVPDKTGLRIGKVLMRASLRGVKVNLLLDGFGCKDLSKVYIRELENSGVHILFFRPKISPWSLRINRLRRMHCKMLVADNTLGFLGGINIIDDYNTPSHIPPRVDYAVKVEGPLISNMKISMELLWYKVNRAYLGEGERKKREDTQFIYKAGNMQAALVLRDNLWRRNEIRQTYFSAFKSAKSEIIIASAYFLPGLQFRNALQDATNRGVRVRLILQKKVEYVLLDFASHGLYSWFLEQGIEIYEYHKSFMHSKVAVIDDSWAMVGSANIDPFSLSLSREANIAVNNSVFAQTLKRDLDDALSAGASRITSDDWQHNHYFKRSFSWLIYKLVRLVMRIALYQTDR